MRRSEDLSQNEKPSEYEVQAVHHSKRRAQRETFRVPPYERGAGRAQAGASLSADHSVSEE